MYLHCTSKDGKSYLYPNLKFLLMARSKYLYHHMPHILVLVVCGVILNHMRINQPPGTVLLVPEATDTNTKTMATTAAETPGHHDDVKEIFGVKIHRNPSQSKLHELGVASWPTWEGSPGQIPWTFTGTETMYLLKGKVKVSCEGHEEDHFQIGAGDLVEFPKGMKISWHVIEAVKKHYNLDK